MPKIVDKEKVREEILMALQRCIEQKPLMNISLRDIAAQAGMSHPKLLTYFDSREDIILSYVRYTRNYMSEKCIQWFEGHPRDNYATNLDYMNAFMEYVAEGIDGENRPNATMHTYVLAHYDQSVRELIVEEYAHWRAIMEQCLIKVYGETVGKTQAEAMMILIAGTFTANYNGALTGEINGNILGSFKALLDS